MIKKETLTKDKILLDIKRLLIENVKSMSILYPLYYILLFLLALFLTCTKISPWFVLLGVIPLTVTYLFSVIEILTIKKRKITVVTGALTSIEDEINCAHTLWFYKPYTLKFNKYGKFGLPGEMEMYSWSELYRADNKGVFRSSNEGDDFYLALFKGKILMVYNSKYFYYINE